MKIVNGNIKNKSLKIAVWNCRRGLVSSDKSASHKITEIKHFIFSNDVDVIGIIESDLHGNKSRYINRLHLNNQEVYDILSR